MSALPNIPSLYVSDPSNPHDSHSIVLLAIGIPELFSGIYALLYFAQTSSQVPVKDPFE